MTKDEQIILSTVVKGYDKNTDYIKIIRSLSDEAKANLVNIAEKIGSVEEFKKAIYT